MAIVKEITTRAGVMTNYHIINTITIDRLYKRIDAQVSSYLDIEARRSKKAPVVSAYYEIPFEVFTNAIVNDKDLLVACYDHLHTLKKFEGGQKELSHIHHEIIEANKPAETKITVSQELISQTLKGNTKYRVTSNAENITATGNNVSIKFNLRYTRHDNSKTTNPQEDKIITSINWRSVGTAPTSFPIEFTTSNYTDENNLHRIYCLNDGVIIGELSEPIEFYLEEIE